MSDTKSFILIGNLQFQRDALTLSHQACKQAEPRAGSAQSRPSTKQRNLVLGTRCHTKYTRSRPNNSCSCVTWALSTNQKAATRGPSTPSVLGRASSNPCARASRAERRATRTRPSRARAEGPLGLLRSFAGLHGTIRIRGVECIL